MRFELTLPSQLKRALAMMSIVVASSSFFKAAPAVAQGTGAPSVRAQAANANVNAYAAANTSTPQTALKANLATTIQNQIQNQKRIEAGWNLSLSGQSFSNEKEQAQTAGLELAGKLRYRLLPQLEMKADAGVSLQSGYAQSRFGDNTPKSGLALREAVLQFKPLNRVTLQAGAIDQGHLNAPLLVSAQAFPGVLERILLGTKEFNAELKAQQAVPTSTTLSTKAVEAEETPTFLTESLTVRAKLFDRMSVNVFGLHYAFRNLPSTVATDSELYGNTVTALTAKRDRFTYDFDGFGYGGGTKILLARHVAWTLDGQILQNAKAPESYNQGQLASSGFEIGLPGDVDVKPKGEIFFAESDVAPGYYNGSDRGHNNRAGWAADLSVAFKKAGFALGGRFVQADLINSSLVQTRQSFVLLHFETLHAPF